MKYIGRPGAGVNPGEGDFLPKHVFSTGPTGPGLQGPWPPNRRSEGRTIGLPLRVGPADQVLDHLGLRDLPTAHQDPEHLAGLRGELHVHLDAGTLPLRPGHW